MAKGVSSDKRMSVLNNLTNTIVHDLLIAGKPLLTIYAQKHDYVDTHNQT